MRRPQTYIRRTNPKEFCCQRSCHFHVALHRHSDNRKRCLHRRNRGDHRHDDATMNAGWCIVGSWCDSVESASPELRECTHAKEVAWVSQSFRPHRLLEHYRTLNFPTAPSKRKTIKMLNA